MNRGTLTMALAPIVFLLAACGGSSVPVMVKRVELQKCVGADCSQHEFFDASGVAGLLDSALQG